MEAGTFRGLAAIARAQGRYDEAQYHAERGVALAREINDHRSLGLCLARLGFIVLAQGDTERAEKCAEESLKLWNELGDQLWITQSLTLLAYVAGFQREYGKQRQYLEQSLTICRNIGDQGWVSVCLCGLGEGARQQGKYAEAVRYYEEAMAINRELGLPATGLLNNLGHAYIGLDEDDVAWRYLREALKEYLAIGRVPGALESLVGVAWLRTKPGHYVQAAELLGLVLGHPALEEGTKRYAEPVLTMVREALPADELETALERGKALDWEQVVAEILEEAE
jgi:tetratricopeptide (TPR) repeat protein